MRRIGPYEIEGEIGHGGMGVVYKGRHVTLGRRAAIKTLLPAKAGDAALRARFINEGQAQARLEHEGIVKVYDAFTDNGELFIAMEYVEGETLATRLQNLPQHRMPLEEVLEISTQFLNALDYVHQQKIIHRDIKPSNVMLCHGRVKLMDWGLAIVDGGPRFTVTNRVAGTPFYMSPEQREGKPLDARTDIYSWGVVMHQMLSGVQDLPPGVSEVVEIAMQPEREKRFASAAEFRDALREGAAGFLNVTPLPEAEETVPYAEPEVLVEQPAPAPQNLSRRSIWLAIAVCCAAMSYATWRVWNRHPLLDIQPPQQRAPSSDAPAPRVILDWATPLPEPKKPEKPALKPQPVLSINPPTQRVAEEAKRVDLEPLREAIKLALQRAENDLRNNSFASAREQVAIAARAAQQSRDLWQETDAIEEMRNRINEAEELERVRKRDEEMWRSRVGEVESDLRNQRWPEAKRFAQQIVDNHDAPEPVRARAAELLQQAKDGIATVFKDTQTGTTKNTIVRKPSSPPRKDR